MYCHYPLLLEKVADMFEAIAHILPPYQQIYDLCARNASGSHLVGEDHHLAGLMSNVYADLVQLCLELYRLCCRGTKSTSIHFFFSHKYRQAGSFVMSAVKAPAGVLLSYHCSASEYSALPAISGRWITPAHPCVTS